jgi:rhodanese-related sulfurtransferase
MTPIQTIFYRLFLSIGLLLGAVGAHAAPTAVDVTQAFALQNQGVLLIDVREPDEYAQGHAPGSTLIPLGQLEKRLGELKGAKDKPIALICRSGSRSGKAQQILEKAGFSKAVNVDGGLNAWAKAGLPVIAGMAAR